MLARSLIRKTPWLELLYRRVRERWPIEVPRVFVIARYSGDHPWTMTMDPAVNAPIMTAADVDDVPAAFVADPFVMRRGDGCQLFFEVMRADTRRGVIAFASSADGIEWRYGRVVLSEDFHLSYPYVFECGDEVFMIPESSGTRSVRLYRAEEYPTHWSYVGDLLQGEDFADSTVFHHDGRWWMFSETGSWSRTGERVGRNDTLRLFHAPALMGPWVEHPASPVVSRDPRAARMAGRVVDHGGRLIRFAQDCSYMYGRQVHAFEIHRLTPEEYAERQLGDGPILGPGGDGWNAGGMHHLDAVLTQGKWIGFVDGWRWAPGARCRTRVEAAISVRGARRR